MNSKSNRKESDEPMDEFQVEIISTENFPPGLSGASVFKDKIHYIFINTTLSPELQTEALAAEQSRKPF